MDDNEFATILKSEIEQANNYYDTELSSDRVETLQFYLGEPFGNEQENRSKVVLSEVRDTIEYLMPSLMRIFASSDKFCRFVGRNAEDVKGAEQATELVNFVLNSQNNGFTILHNFFKDALLFKIGALKTYWDETETTVEETYERLSQLELTTLLDDPAIELKSQEVVEEGVTDQMGNQIPTEQYFNVEVKRRTKNGKVKIENIPPEELIFSRRAKSMDDCTFIGHRTQVKAGDLIERGYDADLVMSLTGDKELDDESERQSRFQDIESSPYDNAVDPTNREVLVTEAYIRADYDGDNVAELRRVIVLGDNYEIVENEPFDKIPFAIVSPILMPHRMVGLSVAEMVMDLQLIKSQIYRQMLDNLYLTNNSRVAVVEGQTNLDDLLSSRPGGIVRMRAPGMVQPLAVPQLGSQAFNMLEYADQIRDQRTGFSKASLGLDPKQLQSTSTNAVNATIQGAQLKIEMIARVFAETGVRTLMMNILHLIQKHQDKAVTIRLLNEYVDIDPRAFANEYDLEVSVGLGNGEEDQKAAMLVQIANKQEQMLRELGINNPVVKPSQYVNTLKKIAEMAGFKDTDQFFSSGEALDQAAEQAQQQPEQNIELLKLQEELKLKREEMEAKIALEREEMLAKIELRKFEFEAELTLRQQKLALGGDISTNLPTAQ